MSLGKDAKKRRLKKLAKRVAPGRGSSREELQERTRAMFKSLGKKASFVDTSGPKLSARILELAEPYRAVAPTDQAIEMLIGTAVIAWNIATQPQEEHAAAIEEALKCFRAPDAEALADGRELFAALIRRKLKLFPLDRRLVASHKLTMAGENMNLSVVSLRPAPDS